MVIGRRKKSSSLIGEGAGGCIYVLLAGLPGTGKSTLAQALAARLPRAVVLSKDETRAALFPGNATDYSEQQNDLCMEAVLAAADYLRRRLNGPQFILFDGRTFSRAAQLQRVIAAAEEGASPWCILHLVCPDAIAETRLKAASGQHLAANRGYALYLTLKQRYEPIRLPHLVIDTSQPVAANLEASLEYIRNVWAKSTEEVPDEGLLRASKLRGEDTDMDKFAIWAQMEAKPGKEAEVEAFLKSAQPLAVAETGTTTWYALKIGPSKYGIFDTFADEESRKAHLSGDIAKALFAKAKELFVNEPQVDTPTILAAKAPGA